MFHHVLLEVYCTKDETDRKTVAPCRQNYVPGYDCLVNNCPHSSFTSHENAICYINERSEAKELITLGGEMLPDHVDEQVARQLWEQISMAKIQQAYDEYMNEIKKH